MTSMHDNLAQRTEGAERPLRVLALAGGGMRGLYTAEYLATLTNGFALKQGVKQLDFGKAFDLIVGTSTGALLACGLALCIPITRLVTLYRNEGRNIFPTKIPRTWAGIVVDFFRRRHLNAIGNDALRHALVDVFGEATFADIYANRKIALAITAVEMARHRSYVFKTPHLSGSNHRDDACTLAQACLASTAAPLFRSLAALPHPSGESYGIFADGGLWANNPVLVAMIEALELMREERFSNRTHIEIFVIDTLRRIPGELLTRAQTHRGYREWRFGADAASLSIDAQEFAFTNMARMLRRHVNPPCYLISFPHDDAPPAFAEYLDLDETRTTALDAFQHLARIDADMANSHCSDPRSDEDFRLQALLAEAPAVTHNSP